MRGISVLLVTALAAGVVHAQVKMLPVNYLDGDTQLRGYIAWDDSLEGKRPGVMVIHEWWGLNDYAKGRARQLAELGYVAFAADMYGDNRVTEHAKDAKGWMQQITANVDTWRDRALRGLQQLKVHPLVDDTDIAAIGYCFGGATVMQMAYTGVEMDAVVSFHGSLPVAGDGEAERIRAKVLVAHGAADGFIPTENVLAFQQALDAANVDWEMDIYGNARHSFTNPGASKYGIDGVAYNPDADQRSWTRMRMFLNQAFAD